MSDMEARLSKLEEDMYFGRGKDNPSIIARMALIEDAISSLKTIKWLLGGAIITALFNIISTHISLKF